MLYACQASSAKTTQKRAKKLLDQAREAIRWKHYSIREERDSNQYAQYDAQPEEQKREALSRPPAFC